MGRYYHSFNCIKIGLWNTKTVRDWNQSCPDYFLTWNQLVQFLETNFRTLEIVLGPNPTIKYALPTSSGNNLIAKHRGFCTTVQEENKRENSCVMCSSPHLLPIQTIWSQVSPREIWVYTNQDALFCFSSTYREGST